MKKFYDKREEISKVLHNFWINFDEIYVNLKKIIKTLKEIFRKIR